MEEERSAAEGGIDPPPADYEPFSTFEPKDTRGLFLSKELSRNSKVFNNPRRMMFTNDISKAGEQWAVLAIAKERPEVIDGRTIREKVTEMKSAAKGSGKSCFLCGFPLSYIGLGEPQVEHILPTTAAFLLLGYPTKGIPVEAHQLNVLTHNYDWAHSYCNSSKKARQFLTVFFKDKTNSLLLFSQIGKTVDYNDSVIETYVDDLVRYSSNKGDKPKNLNKQIIKIGGPEIFRRQAIASIKAKCKPLMDAINEWNTPPGTVTITYLLNVAAALQNLTHGQKTSAREQAAFAASQVLTESELQGIDDVFISSELIASEAEEGSIDILATASEGMEVEGGNFKSRRKRTHVRRKRTRRNKKRRSIKKRYV